MTRTTQAAMSLAGCTGVAAAPHTRRCQKQDDVLLQRRAASVCDSDMIKDDHGLTKHPISAVPFWVGFSRKRSVWPHLGILPEWDRCLKIGSYRAAISHRSVKM